MTAADTSPVAAFPTVHGRVAAARRVTADLLEVTLAGFAGYPLTGGDEFVYTMVSYDDGGIPTTTTLDEVLEQGPDGPLRGAYYTVRRSRPAVGEIDLWVVDHGHPGSVGAWMAHARAGDPVALWGPRRGFRPPPDARHVLLVADPTGFAAVAALIDGLPADRRATAVLAGCGSTDRPPMPDHPGVRFVWTSADDGDRLLRTVAAHVAADRPDAAFGAAESRQVTRVRRFVRDVLGVPAERVSITGYWRRAA